MIALRATGLVLAAFLLGSCGGDDPGSPSSAGQEQASPTTSQPSAAGAEADQTVGVTNGFYSPDRVTLPADESSTLLLANNDPAPHNISILQSRAGRHLFKGRNVAAGESVVYEIPAMKPGRYPIRCDIHAAMRATAVVR